MNKFSVENILKITQVENELELEQASSLFNKMRLLIKDDPSLKPLRTHLAGLIEAYETEHWKDAEKITNEQMGNSDLAEKIVHSHEQFVQQRKTRIKDALQKKGLKQNELAAILGHRKNYMSELINGIRPFSQEDIVIIHKILGIKLEHLMITLIKEPAARRIRLEIKKLNKPKLKLKGKGFNFEFA